MVLGPFIQPSPFNYFSVSFCGKSHIWYLSGLSLWLGVVKSQMVRDGVVKAVRQAMANNRRHQGVQACGKDALSNLS